MGAVPYDGPERAHRQGRCLEPGSGPSPRTEAAGTLTVDVQPPNRKEAAVVTVPVRGRVGAA